MRLVLPALALFLLLAGCTDPTQSANGQRILPLGALPSLDPGYVNGTGPARVILQPPQTISQALYYYSPITATLLATEPWEGTSIIETSGLYDSKSNACEMWYRAGPPGREAIGYARSADSKCRVWEKLPHPVLTDPGGVLMPYVFQKDGAYYMLAKRNVDHGLWLYKSTDKFNWTLAGPSPLLLPSNDSSAWDYEIHNPAIYFQGNEGTLFYEGANGTHWALQIGAIPVRWTGSGLALSGPRPAQPVLPAEEALWRWGSVGNPEIVGIPERHAVMLIAGGEPPGSSGQNGGSWAMGCAVADASSNLSDHASWTDCPNFVLLSRGLHVADPSLIVTNFQKEDNLLLLYSYGQQLIHQAHANLSLGEFYDAQTEPVPGGGAAARQP